MKPIKRIFSLIICLSMLVSLCGCTLLMSKLQVETKDLNGEEDFSLAVLTEEDICAKDNVCYCVYYELEPSGEHSDPASDEDDFHDADFVTGKANTPLSGVTLLQMTYCKEDTVTFTVDCTPTKGNVRIVLLDETLTIVHDFDVEEKSSHTVNGVKGKRFEIRLAGESAEFTVEVSRDFISE